MKKIATIMIFLAMAALTFAQSNTKRAALNIQLEPLESEVYLSEIQTIPLKDAAPFLAYFTKWEGEEVVGLSIRFSKDGVDWTPWEAMHPDAHQESRDEKTISELMFADIAYTTFQLKADRAVPGLECHFYNPGKSREEMRESDSEIVDSRSCPCPIPGFFSREDWCPDGDCPEHPDPAFTQVTHLIVHHSAGSNTASDWAAVVRSIWDFHVNGNGWSDIGYNWLVAPTGKVYLGRGNNIIGAHFCGMNTGTMGVCVMGDFTEVVPTDDAQTSLANLLSWKACNENIDPLGISYHASSGGNLINIAGHRDGCATQCPGNSFYPLMDNIRDQVSYRIIAGCSGLPGATSLTATPSDMDAVLNWTDNTDDESGYLLERAEGSTTAFELLVTLDPNITTYNDPNLDFDTDYYYRIRAFTDADTSAYSNVAQISFNTSATSSLFNQQSVQLYPNPVQNQLTITIENTARGSLSVSLVDVVGHQVVQQQSHNKYTEQTTLNMDLTELPAGIYLLRLRMDEEEGAFRIVKP
ncbi:MAG: hypothetical protein DHS20C18_01980 [Saprospiraceae bacterium]|nr:MAG: hypothetical protein DHS20C18_01980 [Saprospiraceae bacterium]